MTWHQGVVVIEWQKIRRIHYAEVTLHCWKFVLDPIPETAEQARHMEGKFSTIIFGTRYFFYIPLNDGFILSISAIFCPSHLFNAAVLLGKLSKPKLYCFIVLYKVKVYILHFRIVPRNYGRTTLQERSTRWKTQIPKHSQWWRRR